MRAAIGGRILDDGNGDAAHEGWAFTPLLFTQRFVMNAGRKTHSVLARKSGAVSVIWRRQEADEQ